MEISSRISVLNSLAVNMLMSLSKNTCGRISRGVELLGHYMVSFCCWNKLAQACWLKTTWIYSLTVVEIGSVTQGLSGLKPRCGQGCVSYETSRGDFLPCLFQLLGECSHSLDCSLIPLSSKPAVLRLSDYCPIVIPLSASSFHC